MATDDPDSHGVMVHLRDKAGKRQKWPASRLRLFVRAESRARVALEALVSSIRRAQTSSAQKLTSSVFPAAEILTGGSSNSTPISAEASAWVDTQKAVYRVAIFFRRICVSTSPL